MVADYGFLRARDEAVSTFLGLCVRPWKIFSAIQCKVEGTDPLVVKRVAQVIKGCGLVHFSYKSDREPAIRALLAEAAVLAGVKAEEDEAIEEPDAIVEDEDAVQPAPKQQVQAPAAVPETSSPGESQEQWRRREVDPDA